MRAPDDRRPVRGIECGPRGGGAGRSLRRFLGEQLMDQRREPLGHLGPDGSQRRRNGRQMRRDPVRRCLGAVRRPAGEEFVEHAAERVEVGPPVDGTGVQLLGRRIPQRPDVVAVAGQARLALDPHDAEVDDLRRAGGRAQHDVGWLQVAVHDSGGMRGVQAGAHLIGDGAHPVHRQPAIARHPARHPGAGLLVGQRTAGDQFHHEIGRTVVLAEVVGRDDVGVVEGGDGARLLPEAGHGGVGLDEVLERHDLDGHVPAERTVVAAEHRAETTSAQLGPKLVTTRDDGAVHCPPTLRNRGRPRSAAPRHRPALRMSSSR